MTDACPGCGAPLTAPDGSRLAVGMEIPGAYDGVLFWHCEECGHGWHHWREGQRPYDLAETYVAAWNEAEGALADAILGEKA